MTLRSDDSRRAARRQGGAALVIAMFLLAMMGLVGIYSLDTVSIDQQVAGFQNRKKVAFYAAEAAVAEAFDNLETTGTPSVAPGTMGDSSLYPYGLPAYDVDTSSPNPVLPYGNAAMKGMSLAIGQGGGSRYSLKTWRVQVIGTAPAGEVQRLEVAAQRFGGNF